MSKFYGFELIKLNKAIGNVNDPINSFKYELDVYNGFGVKSTKTMKVRTVDSTFCKLRMNGDRFAIRGNGACRVISETEFSEYLNRYKGAST